MKLLRKFLWLLLLAFMVIQFFRPEKNSSSAAPNAHISQKFLLPEDVKQVLATSCYDCHSNNTRYPWYFSVQPVAWWLNDHIQEAKKGLNFDEFTTYRLRRQYHKFEEIGEMIKEDKMPLNSYTIIHRAAVLTPEQKEKIIQWSIN